MLSVFIAYGSLLYLETNEYGPESTFKTAVFFS